MSDKTAIQWADASWNPITGCTKVSPGCDNCYAQRFAERFRGVAGHHFEQGFDLRVYAERFDQPLRWKKPRRIFVNSMSDLFHGDLPIEVVARVFNVMRKADHHIYQVLTKRAGRMCRLVRQWTRSRPPPRHVWLGVSVENQAQVKRRVPMLIDTPAAVRFLSVEPLLEKVRLGEYLKTRAIHWVIVGGESGPKARPMDKYWVETIRADCQLYGVPFFFKQWGGPTAKSGGRLLEGRTWDEMPDSAQRTLAL